MSRPAERSIPGAKLRRLRREIGLTQVLMAERLGLSASYLNLIEHDQRPLTLAVLLRLGQVFGIDLNSFAEDEEARLAAELAEAFADPVMSDPGIAGRAGEGGGGANDRGRPGAAEFRELAVVSAPACRGVIALYRAHRRLREEADGLAERLRDSEFLAGIDHEFRTLLTSVRSFSEILQDNADLDPQQRQRFLGIVVEESKRLLAVVDRALEAGPPAAGSAMGGARPAAEEVADLLQQQMNHFPPLEALAARLRSAARLDPGAPDGGEVAAPGAGGVTDQLTAYLGRVHGMTVRVMRVPPPDRALRIHDPAARVVELAEILPAAERATELAHVLALLEGGAAIDECLAEARLGSAEARRLARIALADYAALALLMPYDAMLAAARELRYDVDRLALRFGVGFEAVCRRLVTLQRPGARGVPLYFVTLDLAGNVSARFSAAPVRIARYSGVCPLWNAHAAFLTPGIPRTQLSRMPDGTAYLSIARTVERPAWGPSRPHQIAAVELGCEAVHAGELAFARGLDLDSEDAAVPIGTTCRLCERRDCPQRALPPVGSGVAIDETRRLPGVAAVPSSASPPG